MNKKGLVVTLGILLFAVYANDIFCLTGEELFQRLEKRYGWDRIQDMDISGVMYVPMEDRLSPFQEVRVMWKREDKARIVTRIIDTDLETIMIKDGKCIWMSSPFDESRGISLFSEPEQEEDPISYYYGILEKGRIEIIEETKDFYVVNIEPGITGWIDKKAFILRKVHDKKSGFMTSLLDYKERNGFLYPSKILTKDENGVIIFKIKVKAIKFNSGISDKVFEIPKKEAIRDMDYR